MSQLFSNLLSNALKFTREDISPVISIVTSQLSEEEKASSPNLDQFTDYYKIEFKDNGIGFNNEYTDRIFNIFQRLHRKSEYEGTGIGLAMCKRLPRNHKGEIYAHSDGISGAVFTIILPK